MKKLKINYFFVAALLLGGGLNFANASLDPAANVFNSNEEGQAPNWQPITENSQNLCGDASERLCTGYRETPTSAVTTISTGEKP